MNVERGPEHAYEAYNEHAFRHFLRLERKRAERTGRSLLLLLVDLRPDLHGDSRMTAFVSSKLLAAIASSVREVDFIGWYKEGQVAAAVLTQGADASSSDLSRRIGTRVGGALSDRLPAALGRRLQVRVLELKSRLLN
jgi:hypothetical protein